MAMSLREKLKSFAMDNHIEKYAEHNSKQLEKIAEEFAIGFLDFAKSETDYDAWDSKFDYKGKLYNSKGLLEIYKKEKGL